MIGYNTMSIRFLIFSIILLGIRPSAFAKRPIEKLRMMPKNGPIVKIKVPDGFSKISKKALDRNSNEVLIVMLKFSEAIDNCDLKSLETVITPDYIAQFNSVEHYRKAITEDCKDVRPNPNHKDEILHIHFHNKFKAFARFENRNKADDGSPWLLLENWDGKKWRVRNYHSHYWVDDKQKETPNNIYLETNKKEEK
jgi:hypothetical protein